MSIITKADLAGSTEMGEFAVCNVTLGVMGVDSGVSGCVKSNPVSEDQSQKSWALPMTVDIVRIFKTVVGYSL